LAAAPRYVERRPKLASECTNLVECEKWRRQLVDEMNRKIGKMGSLTMADKDRIMSLNDECNRIYRILGHWERQIRALGGADYRTGPNAMSAQAVSGENAKYLYFGISKTLPEVKEILSRRTASLSQSAVQAVAKKRIDAKLMDHEYYGFHDDDLVAAEALVEEKARKRASDEFVPPKKRGGEDDDDGCEVIWDESWSPPDRATVDAALLELRKRQVLEKYASGIIS